MKVAFTAKDKKRIKIYLLLVVIGLLIIGAAFTPWLNPPQCDVNQTPGYDHCIIGANIGAGLMWLLGMATAIGGGIALTASLVFALVAGNTKKSKTAQLITALVVGCIVLAGWYFFIGAPSMKRADYRAEIQKRQANFVKYNGTPNISSVSGQSAALIVKPAAGNASSITIDLHDCSPGAAKVSYTTGTAHFAFSGVRKDTSLKGLNASECVFYVGTETTNQNWDGLLYEKCVSPIGDTLAKSQQEFQVTDNGILFGNFLDSFCTDLR